MEVSRAGAADEGGHDGPGGLGNGHAAGLPLHGYAERVGEQQHKAAVVESAGMGVPQPQGKGSRIVHSLAENGAAPMETEDNGQAAELCAPAVCQAAAFPGLHLPWLLNDNYPKSKGYMEWCKIKNLAVEAATVVGASNSAEERQLHAAGREMEQAAAHALAVCGGVSQDSPAAHSVPAVGAAAAAADGSGEHDASTVKHDGGTLPAKRLPGAAPGSNGHPAKRPTKAPATTAPQSRLQKSVQRKATTPWR